MAATRAIIERWLRRLRRWTTIDAKATPADERHARDARAGMLRETIEVANYSAVAHLAVSVVLGCVFWGHASGTYLIGLNVVMGVLITTALGGTFWFRKRFRSVVSEDFVRHGFTLSKRVALLIGLVWSTMPVVLLPSSEGGYQLIVVATTAGLISDAYVVGPIMAVSTLLVSPIVIGGYIGLSYCAYPFGIDLSVLLTVYVLFVLFSTRRMSALSYQRLLDRILVEDQSQTIGLLLNDFEEGASDWLWETDTEGRLRHVPSRMAAAMASEAQLPTGTSLTALLRQYGGLGSDENGVSQVLDAMARRQAFHDHVVCLDTSQGPRWWRLNGKPSFEASGHFDGYRGVGSDITQSREAEQRINYLASHDALTGLLNRGVFQGAIEQVYRQPDPSGCMTALLYIDLDGFKAINDGNSHTVGDLLLQAVADRLSKCCDARTRAFRLGGDEFAMLHDCDGPVDAERLAEHVVQALRRPYAINGTHLGIGASIGLAYAPDDAQDTAILLSRADLALYRAKATGKNRWVHFDPELERRMLRRQYLDGQMRAALHAGAFDLHYQPQVDKRTDRVVGVEALLRWETKEEGWISPAEVIPIAEATGFVCDIGRWALHKACTDILAWPGLTVAVNISSIHFRSPLFCEEVEAILVQTGLHPGRLEIEITESILLEGGTEVTTNMRRLRSKGVRLALDDFGTGYSSLSYLGKFTFDKLKIDRSFVQDLHMRKDMLAILEAIHGMAKALKMSVTIEGVETEQQLNAMQQQFEVSIQGYYYSRPLALTVLSDFLFNREAQVLLQSGQDPLYLLNPEHDCCTRIAC